MLIHVTCFIVILGLFNVAYAAWTYQQLYKSLDIVGKACAEGVGVDIALVEGLHRGEWPEDNDKLKCFALCCSQASGALNRKSDFMETKWRYCVETVLPPGLRSYAHAATDACKDVYKQYKDPCDKWYYSTKCVYYFNPKKFLYPYAPK